MTVEEHRTGRHQARAVRRRRIVRSRPAATLLTRPATCSCSAAGTTAMSIIGKLGEHDDAVKVARITGRAPPRWSPGGPRPTSGPSPARAARSTGRSTASRSSAGPIPQPLTGEEHAYLGITNWQIRRLRSTTCASPRALNESRRRSDPWPDDPPPPVRRPGAPRPPWSRRPRGSRWRRRCRSCRAPAGCWSTCTTTPTPTPWRRPAGLKRLVEQEVDAEVTLALGGIVGRAENRAMVDVVRIVLTPIEEIVLSKFDRIAIVDSQPGTGNNSLPAGRKVDMVIDHHPLRQESQAATWCDVRSDLGATSTIVLEYLRDRRRAHRLAHGHRAVLCAAIGDPRPGARGDRRRAGRLPVPGAAGRLQVAVAHLAPQGAARALHGAGPGAALGAGVGQRGGRQPGRAVLSRPGGRGGRPAAGLRQGASSSCAAGASAPGRSCRCAPTPARAGPAR